MGGLYSSLKWTNILNFMKYMSGDWQLQLSRLNMTMILVIFVIFYIVQIKACQEEVIEGQYQDFRSCTNQYIREALKLQSGCQLHPIPLMLPFPDRNKTKWQQMTPTHVEVSQCSGACPGPTDCTPLKTKKRKIPLMLGRCGAIGGKCEKQCATVEVEEHIECGCSCHLIKDDCRNITHQLNLAKCECECKDAKAKRLCLDQGRIWEDKTCTCGCPSSNLCPSGSTLSNVTCLCEINAAYDTTDITLMRSGLHIIMKWEYIAIGILLLTHIYRYI